jgi:hypothetical protein
VRIYLDVRRWQLCLLVVLQLTQINKILRKGQEGGKRKSFEKRMK